MSSFFTDQAANVLLLKPRKKVREFNLEIWAEDKLGRWLFMAKFRLSRSAIISRFVGVLTALLLFLLDKAVTKPLNHHFLVLQITMNNTIFKRKIIHCSRIWTKFCNRSIIQSTKIAESPLAPFKMRLHSSMSVWVWPHISFSPQGKYLSFSIGYSCT